MSLTDRELDLIESIYDDVYHYIFDYLDSIARYDAGEVSGPEAGRIAHIAAMAAKRTYRDVLSE